MGHLVNYLRFRPTEILSPLKKRFLLIPHVCMSLLVGLACLFDEQVRQASSIVQIFDWLSPTVMGISFLFAFLLGIYTLITGSWRTYVATNLTVFGLSMSWFVSLLVMKYIILTFPISIASLGIWAFIISDCIVIAAANNKVIRTRDKL